MNRLNLGCGKDYKEGWMNIDVNDVKKDVSHDLNKIPYPFKKSYFDEVYMKMILEHLNDPLGVLKEIVRISKDNAKISIIVPHAFSYASKTDLQHKTNFTENSFSEELLEEYNLKELKLVRKEFLFPNNKWKKYIPLKKYLKIFFNGIYDDLLFEFVVKK